jgi:hypothetical protein
MALPVHQQNAQAAKTTPVVTNRLRTIKASFISASVGKPS